MTSRRSTLLVCVLVLGCSAQPTPSGWHYPVRQSLGVALLQAGRPAEAEAVYREDLCWNPENGRSLFGLAQSLRAQGKVADAAAADARFRAVWVRADDT